MTSRIGIELSSSVYRLIELERPRSGPHGVETPITAFAALPLRSAQTTAAFASLRGRVADVVVWTRSDHRQVVVDDGPYIRMRAEARRLGRTEYGRPTYPGGRPAFGDVDLESERTVADIAPTSDVIVKRRRTVLMASAPAGEIAARLRPLIAADIKIGAVLTPAAALQSIARARRSQAGPGIEAYVALGETATCLAMMRGGALVAARDLPWGSLDVPERDNLAARLADEILSFTSALEPDRHPLEQVAICGGMAELRSMSVALMERLDVEVEPLDSLFAIDTGRLDGRADDFRDRAADFRLAWAAAAEIPSLDLYRGRRAHAARANLSLAVAVAGAVAGLAVGIQVQGWWRPGPIAPAGRLTRLEISDRPGNGNRQALPPPVNDVTPLVVTRTQPVRLNPTLPPSASGLRTRDQVPERPRSEPVLPFGGVLETILYGSERKLAIVDGRIVQAGDAVNGTRIVDISERTVMLRDREGRLQRLDLAGNNE